MKKQALKICFVTGSRAEYGLLYPLLQRCRKDVSVELQLVVTGMHLLAEFGSTWQQIEQDGFHIDRKIDMLLAADSDSAITISTGLGLIGMAGAFKELQPNWVVLLGDRFETFAAAIAAHMAKIPIAHLHGGELTEGATDDAMRHAITKMAYLHFTATAAYRKRVIQLGEHPARVFNTGAIGIDNIRELPLLSKAALSKDLGFNISDNTLLVTYHPVTLEHQTAKKQMQALLTSLEFFTDCQFLFTLPNADAGGRVIMDCIRDFVSVHPGSAYAFPSLGQLRYLSALQYVKAVVGNSSSGLIEVPYFGKPTVNIGDRQKGRIRPASVIDTGESSAAIKTGIKKALSTSFANKCRAVRSPYGNGQTAGKILEVIKKAGVPSSVKKHFFDLI